MEQLRRELVAEYRWSDEAFAAWQSQDFRCAYCGLDLIQTIDAYKLGEIEHILPQSKYHEIADSPSNQTVACRISNFIKRCWDPNKDGGPPLYSGGAVLSDQVRAELLERTRLYIARLRIEESRELLNVQQLILEYRVRQHLI